jgi:hypothetical protein
VTAAMPPESGCAADREASKTPPSCRAFQNFPELIDACVRALDFFDLKLAATIVTMFISKCLVLHSMKIESYRDDAIQRKTIFCNKKERRASLPIAPSTAIALSCDTASILCNHSFQPRSHCIFIGEPRRSDCAIESPMNIHIVITGEAMTVITDPHRHVVQ